ncbi:pectinesterase family protein [Spirosoma aerophilum]
MICTARFTLLFITVLTLAKSTFAQRQQITVAQDGHGDFTTVQAALNSVPANNKSRIVIRIRKGVYKEKLKLDSTQHLVTLIGDDKASTILTYDDYSGKVGPDGVKFRTFTSSSVSIFGNDFRAENLTFENTSGPVGQAVALYVTGDRAVFINCRFLGFQDTLYTGMPDHHARQYYKDCYIEGTVDFIFGSATAVFEHCTIFSKKEETYITAAATPEGMRYGFVFMDCQLSSQAQPASVYLGRPWRDFAKTVFIRCQLGAHIKPEGWHNWDKPQAEKTSVYAEYESSGPGANPMKRVGWSKQLSREDAKAYTVQRVLAGDDHWKPTL